MADLEFSARGAAQVLAEQQKIIDGLKKLIDTNKSSQTESANLAREVNRVFSGTRTEYERLQAQADKLRSLIGNTKLPELDRGKALDALQRVKDKMREVATEADKAAGATKKIDQNAQGAGAALTEAFGEAKTSLLGSFATRAGAIVGVVAGVAKAINDELRASQELANQIAATQISVSASRNVVIRNLPGVDDQTIQQVLRENESLAAATGVGETFVNQARASALSASGGDVQSSLAATEIAAKFLADRPGDIGKFAGSLLDLSKVTGTKDAKANLGLLATVGGLSRITDQQQIAQNVPAALINSVEAGLTTAQSAALFSAITTATGDFTGATSGTATIALAEKLRAFDGPNNELKGLSPGEKLQRLQQDPRLSSAFYGAGEGFELKTRGVIRSLLTDPTGEAATAFAANLKNIPETAGLAARGEQSLAAFRNNTLEGRASVSRRLTVAQEGLRTIARGDSLSDEEVAQLKEILQLTGDTATTAGQRISAARGFDRKLSRSEAAAIVEAELRSEESSLGIRTGLRRSSGDASGFTAEQLEQQQSMVTLLGELLKALQEGNEGQKQQTEEIKRRNPSVGAN